MERATDLFAAAPLDRRASFAEHAKAAFKRTRNSKFEDEFAFQCRALKLPAPLTQHRWATALRSETGRPRQFTADFAWPQFNLLVEVQGGIWRVGGGAHSRPAMIERDIDKQQCAVLLGLFLLPVTTDEVKTGNAIALVQRVLAARGWVR